MFMVLARGYDTDYEYLDRDGSVRHFGTTKELFTRFHYLQFKVQEMFFL